MKKFLLTLAATISLVAGPSLGANPAFAFSMPISGFTSYTIGDSVSLDLGCQEAGALVTFDGQLPDGLTVDDAGLVTGIPTKVGGFVLSNYACDFNGMLFRDANWALNINILSASARDLGGQIILRAIPLNNETCDFRIIGVLPSSAKPGSTKIILWGPGQTDTVTMTISDHSAAGVMDFTFSADNIGASIVNQGGIASFISDSAPDVFSCNTPLEVSIEYDDLLNSHWWTMPALSPFTPTTNRSMGTIGAYRALSGACSISVNAWAFEPHQPIAISVMGGMGEIMLANMSFDDDLNGQIEATISLANTADFDANIPISDKEINGILDCSGIHMVTLRTTSGVIATTLVDLTPRQTAVCNAGSTINSAQDTCTEVEKGFYSTDLNSTVAIPCPAGSTTALTGSKSVNDCYKPDVQSIVSFKSPKALKFKGVTNLAITTNNKTLASFSATGSCTAKIANVVTTVKGKKITTKVLKVTAGKNAGTCSVTLTSPAIARYLALSKVVQIKVSKTGK